MKRPKSNNALDKETVLWTKNFILVFLSNFLLFYSFYMLIPILPIYLLKDMGTTNSVAGVVLALYTVSALLIRPFSGFLVDKFSRKPLYLLCYGAFSLLFAGYIIGPILILFVALRIFHGFAFGLSTVSGSTVAVDLMPHQRRGEGIGYFGMASNIAMAIGPVAGLAIYKHFSIDMLFAAALVSSMLGFVTITMIKPVKKEKIPDAEEKIPLSLDRFILLKALPCVALLFLAGIGYGAMLNYLGLYSEKSAFRCSAGIFFTIFAIGIVLARILSAKAINNGKIAAMAIVGSTILTLAFFFFIFCGNALMFYAIAFFLGLGFGYVSPAFQTMLINLARHDQRGTANATYFTFWDMGIGIGTIVGGVVLERLDFAWLYAICTLCLFAGTIYFIFVSARYFDKMKLR